MMNALDRATLGLLAPLTVGLTIAPVSLAAQARGLEVTYGRWFKDQTASVYGAAYFRPLVGPLSVGIGAVYLADRHALSDRTQTGGELALVLGRRGTGPHAVGTVGFGIQHTGGALDAAWSAGAGYTWQPISFISLGAEARYRVEDQALRGFWRLDPGDRRGAFIQFRVAVGSGLPGRRGRAGGALPSAPSAPPVVPPAGIVSSVVATALDAMGSPYTWGGSDSNGYDCSGLIQYAYNQHGIPLPRISREQAAAGKPVPRDLTALRPGDILGFATDGDRVTHVGLYVGEGQFIHSATAGVRLSSLTATDPDSQWWQSRWVTARRVIE